MTTMKPTVGRIVHLFPGQNALHLCANGNTADDPVAAVIVRVWDDYCVNLMALVDGPSPIWVTSVRRADMVPADSVRWNWPEIVPNVVPTGKPLA